MLTDLAVCQVLFADWAYVRDVMRRALVERVVLAIVMPVPSRGATQPSVRSFIATAPSLSGFQ
jgi:hypothetical protein